MRVDGEKKGGIEGIGHRMDLRLSNPSCAPASVTTLITVICCRFFVCETWVFK